MNEIKLNEENWNLSFSKEFLEKMEHLIKNSGLMGYERNNYLKEIKNNEIDYYYFREMIGNITASVNRELEYVMDNQEFQTVNLDLYNEVINIIDKYNECNPDHKRNVIKIRGRQIEHDLKEVENFLNILYDYKTKYRNLDTLRDLYRLIEDCKINMSYFKSAGEIDEFINQYQEYIKNGDVSSARTLLDNLQQEILHEWEIYIKDVDNMTDDNFCFIGHSTHSTEFGKEFYDNYVSTSLYNQDLNDTYNLPFGFIMNPTNIVGAKSSDMYVKNSGTDDEDILSYSIVPKIDHPKRVLKESLTQKEENRKEGNKKKVYSEVIKKGFDPIGIFCFTDGSLNLDSSYCNAYKLQKSFPNLKVKVFDTFKKKKGEDLIEAKLRLINNLEQDSRKIHHITDYFPDIKEEDLPRYEMFFKEFSRLKENGNYNEDDIRNIYANNQELISVFFDFNELFTDKYNDETRRFILGNNYSLNLNLILTGNIRKNWLTKIKHNLSPHIGKLNQYYDGLDEFVTVLNKFEIEEDVIRELSKLDNINFYTMTRYLLSKLNTNLQEDSDKTKDNLSKLKEQYEQLEEELRTRNLMEEQYHYYRTIENNEFYYSYIKREYLEILKDTKNNSLKNKELSEKMQTLQVELEHLEIEKANFMNRKYEHTSEYHEIEKRLSELTDVQNTLSQHPILNYRTIRKNKQEIEICNSNNKARESVFYDNIHIKLNEIENQIITLKTRIEYLKDKQKNIEIQINTNHQYLSNLEAKTKKLFDCSINEVEEKIKVASEFVAHYDYGNQYEIEKLKQDIQKILKITNMERQKLDKNDQEQEEMKHMSDELDRRNYRR